MTIFFVEQLQELEMENEKLKRDLGTLRKSIASADSTTAPKTLLGECSLCVIVYLMCSNFLFGKFNLYDETSQAFSNNYKTVYTSFQINLKHCKKSWNVDERNASSCTVSWRTTRAE